MDPRPRGGVAVGMVAAAAVGLLAGLGAYTFRYAEGLSYFSADPRACVNCHIMREQYASWQHSPHHAVATCVQCHLPHATVPKLWAKAKNGWNHSKAFTLQDFPEPIRLRPVSLRILERNCVECHGDLVSNIVGHDATGGTTPSCVHCHASVGHGPQR